MKKILFLLLLLTPLLGFTQTPTEISNVLNASQSDLYITGQGSQTALNQNIILASAGTGATDCQASTGVYYRSVALQITPASGTVTAGTVIFEASNDNFVTSIPVYLKDFADASGNSFVSSYSVVASTTRTFEGKLSLRYFRARISTGLTGTTTGLQCFSVFRIPDYNQYSNLQDQPIVGASTGTAGNNALLPSTGTAAIDVLGYRSATVQIVTTSTGGTYNFEGSNDNVNFFGLPVLTTSTVGGTFLSNTAIAATSSSLSYTVGLSCRFFRLRVITTITGGGAAIQAFTRLIQTNNNHPASTVVQGTAANLNVTAAIAAAQTLATVTTVGTVSTITNTGQLTPGTAAANLGKAEDAVHTTADVGVQIFGVRQDAPPATPATSASGDYGFVALNRWNAVVTANYEKHAKTYSSCDIITPVASATDISILPGNASTTVYVTKVTVSGIQTTGGLVQVFLTKRSTANSGGTSTSFTVVPHDAADAAASSTPLNYSANPTPGTSVGSVRRTYTPFGAATVTTNGIVEFNFGDKGKPIVLSGTAQGLAVNLNGVTLTGGSIDICYEWFEI